MIQSVKAGDQKRKEYDLLGMSNVSDIEKKSGTVMGDISGKLQPFKIDFDADDSANVSGIEEEEKGLFINRKGLDKTGGS